LRVWLKPDMTLTIGRQTAGWYQDLVPSTKAACDHATYTKLTLRDLRSKHGVFINGARIEPDKEVEIIIGGDKLWTTENKRHVAGRGYGGYAEITIGERTSFRLERVDFGLCSSGMSVQDKLQVVESAVDIDAKVDSTTWISGTSTHLIIGNNKQTEKMYLALAEGGHLVNLAWLEAMKVALEESWVTRGQKFNPPLEIDYPAPIPEVYQGVPIDWQPNFDRRILFQHVRFIALTATKSKSLEQLIRCAGGELVHDSSTPGTKLVSQCLKATVLPAFLTPPSGSLSSEMYESMDSILNKMKYRWIKEDEVGKAILFASTDMFCNPKYLEALRQIDIIASLSMSQFPATIPASVPATFPATIMATSSAILDDQLKADEEPESDHTTDTSNDYQADQQGDDASGSFSLSLMMPTKRSVRSPLLTSGNRDSSSRTSSVVDKPVKKKAKTDRMAVFFDGLDDDEDDEPVAEPSSNENVEAHQGRGPSQLPISLSSRSSPSILSPVPGPWPTSKELTNAENGKDKSDSDDGADIVPTSKDIDEKPDSRNAKPSLKVLDSELSKSTPTTKKVDMDYQKDDLKGAKQSQQLDPVDIVKEEEDSLSQLFPLRASSRKKKPSSFDAVRNDMDALQIEVKLERQKDHLDEQERQRRFGIQTSKKGAPDSMVQLMPPSQSGRGEHLLARTKRSRLAERDPSVAQEAHWDASGSISVSLPLTGRLAENPEETQEKTNWPERWKTAPNFKLFKSRDLHSLEKWKNVPNFKTFRKSIMPGVSAMASLPIPYSFEGEPVVEKTS
ncbi:hypothetical protein BGW38_005156, partial [Lunasporangiospora selenospora]